MHLPTLKFYTNWTLALYVGTGAIRFELRLNCPAALVLSQYALTPCLVLQCP